MLLKVGNEPEHNDYTSAGYEVSSRFGKSEYFKWLANTTHGLGLLVFLDSGHSYASPETLHGLSLFDGANACYYHTSKRGHPKYSGMRMFQ